MLLTHAYVHRLADEVFGSSVPARAALLVDKSTIPQPARAHSLGR